jgi:hypothetical protein
LDAIPTITLQRALPATFLFFCPSFFCHPASDLRHVAKWKLAFRVKVRRPDSL